MSRRPTFALALSTSILLSIAAGTASVAAASSVTECGQLSGYTAPDPGGPADGSVHIGLSETWTILADATLSPAAAASLPTVVNSGPTCLAMDLDDEGRVTALDFAGSGEIRGQVDFDPDSTFYIFNERLIIPAYVTDPNPGLAALFVTSYQARSPLAVTFTVDTANGNFSGFDGTAAFCGPGAVTPGGDGQVGDAVIAASILDADDLDALAGAGSRETCATIQAVGSIAQDGAIDITTDVDIQVAAPVATAAPVSAGAAAATGAPAAAGVTPPPTSTAPAASTAAAQDVPILAWLATILLTALAIGGLRRNRRERMA